MKILRFITVLLGVAAFVAPLAADYVFTHLAGPLGGPGNADGAPTIARFALPRAMTIDAAGNLYVVDALNRAIRKVSPAGVVSTVASTPGTSPAGIAIDANGAFYVSDSTQDVIHKITAQGASIFAGSTYLRPYLGSRQIGINRDGQDIAARFFQPSALAFDRLGNLYVADTGNQTIRKILADGYVTTLAGSANQRGSTDGTGSAALFNYPGSVAVDSQGNLIIGDNSTVRRMTPAGAVTTLAGQGDFTHWTDGVGSNATFASPRVAVGAGDVIFVADQTGHVIRRLAPDTAVTTIAGLGGTTGSTDGTGSAARFFNPAAVALDASGNIFIADAGNDTIRRITPAGAVTTLAGVAGASGAVDGVGPAASFDELWGIAVDRTGNVFVADRGNHRVRKITPDSQVTTFAPSNGRFLETSGIAVDAAGNVYTADAGANIIRKITPEGVDTTLAGQSRQWGSTDGPGATARFGYPVGLALAKNGTLYVADAANQKIRAITPDGIVSTVPASSTEVPLIAPNGVAVDDANNLYVADRTTHLIVKITPAGVLTAIAGAPYEPGHADGVGATARFRGPCGVALDRQGNLFVADTGNNTIRQITPAGVVTTIGGDPQIYGSADGRGRDAHFFTPHGIAVDAADNLYIAEEWNGAVRKGTLHVGPTIQTQPQSQTVGRGAAVTFSVVATGAPAPAFQWNFNGTPLPGATSDRLTLASARDADAGNYTVTVTNTSGAITSNVATLTVTTGGGPTNPPSSGNGRSGGGGSPSLWFIAALLALSTWRLRIMTG